MSKIPYKVLMVDDSSLICDDIYAILEASDVLHMAARVNNENEAFKKITKLKPDVIIVSVSLKIDVLKLLKILMIRYSIPIIMFSDLTDKSRARITFDALRYGAVDFISSVVALEKEAIEIQKEQIIRKICVAARVKTQAVEYIRMTPTENKNKRLSEKKGCHNLVVLGVAEGGYGSLLKIIPQLKVNDFVAYMVIFYEKLENIEYFIEYLSGFSQVLVQKTVNDDLLTSGVCYLSSGEEYVTVNGDEENLTVYVDPAPFLSHRGSIDMLMFSVTEILGNYTIGTILSGAGSDGAEGLEEIVRVGGNAIIQSPASCLYKGMSLAALNLCNAESVVADRDIAAEINNFLINSVV